MRCICAACSTSTTLRRVSRSMKVESVDSIVKRFKTAAMSYGALSEGSSRVYGHRHEPAGRQVQHRRGGGEAEGPLRHRAQLRHQAGGVCPLSASPAKYLVSASEIQIKMAQGAKPGEGGQLTGGKVYPWVAKTRHSRPALGSFSPPHHDIYSIEDLAQLIYDLKCANRKAAINVKLVSEAGVGIDCSRRGQRRVPRSS